MFTTENIVGNSHHCKSPTCRQEPKFSCAAAIRKWTHSRKFLKGLFRHMKSDYSFSKSDSLSSTSSTSSIENDSRKVLTNPLIAIETKEYWWLHFRKTAGLFGFNFLFFFSKYSDFELFLFKTDECFESMWQV